MKLSKEKEPAVMATCLADMITGKQINMIRAMAASAQLNYDEECGATLSCSVSELSKFGAGLFIDHLQKVISDQNIC